MKSWVEVSGERLRGNLRAVREAAGPGVETLAVVKANAYGHGAELVGRLLVEAGVRWLGVTDVEEGARVRAAVGDGARVMVMSAMEPADSKEIVTLGLTPVVWTVEHVEALERAAEAAGARVRVHLEVDTGMGRQGVGMGGVAEIARRLAGSRWVLCEGVMSHLSSAEVAESGVAESGVTEAQRRSFGAALEAVTGAGIRPQWVHLGNTSAVDEGGTMVWVQEVAEGMGARAMVRTGLGLYGYCLPVEGGGAGKLAGRVQPVLTWKTRVVGVREIEAGETVGYGATFRAEGRMRLALLPVGYADGFRREGSSGVGDGWVMVRGVLAAVVGRVSMNLVVVDVTDIAGVGVGDEVVLVGDGVSAEDVAVWCGTIAYDVLCGVLRGRRE